MLPKKFNDCLEQIRSGNQQGIVILYHEYREKIILTALAKVKSLPAAEDIASDFFKYLLESVTDIPYIDKPNAWVFRVIRNKAVDYIRKDIRTVYSDCVEDIAMTRATSDDSYSDFINGIDVLSEREKEIVTLHYIYGFKYKEISKIIDIKEGSIKRIMFEIKEKLRDSLNIFK